jgi:TolB protein
MLCLLASAASGQEATELPDIPGRIAYVGTDFNVYTLDPAADTRVALTDDAGIGRGQLRYYQWPTWARDGRLAYFLTELDSSGAGRTEVFVSADGAGAGESLYVGEGEAFTYASWSPQACGDDCYDLTVLLSSGAENSLIVEWIRDSADGERRQIGSGAPFYSSWSPDGARILWHRNNDTLDIFDVNSGDISETLPQTPGAFFTPAWSPVDDRLLFGARAADGNSTDLLITASDETMTIAAALDEPIWFAWSPDGNQIAYRSARGPLFVIDAVTHETVVETSAADMISFFWSPDSQSIAYVSPALAPGSFNAKPAAQDDAPPELSWSVLNVASGAVRRFGAFVPTNDMVYLLTYFDQFAPSHRVWSPDSRHLIYSETATDGTATISLLDTTQDIAVPLTIADGFIGVWSFG